MVRMRKAHGIIVENPEARDKLGDQNIDSRKSNL
jgi:hypothetical protein